MMKEEMMLHMNPMYPHKKGWMSMRDRAARFSPFAALTVHDELVKDKEKSTLEWREAEEPEGKEEIKLCE